MDKDTQLTRPKLYDENINPDFNTKIIDGNSSCVVASRLNRLGDIAKKNFKLQASNFWTPEEVNLKADALQWKTLDPDYKYAVKVVLSYINFLDSKMSIMPSDISKYLSLNEFHLPLAFQMGMEAMHTHSYSYIYEELMDVDEETETAKLFFEDPILNDRINEVVKYTQALSDDATLENLNKAILSIFILEGIYFFNGFNFFYYLESNGILPNVAKILSTINRDEVSHLILFKEIIKVLKEDGQWVLTEEQVYEQFQKAVDVETTFSVNLFSPRFLPFTEQKIRDFVQHLANKRLSFIGYKDNPFKKYKSNPFKIFSRFEPEGDTQTKEVNTLIGVNMDYQKVSDKDLDW